MIDYEHEGGIKASNDKTYTHHCGTHIYKTELIVSNDKYEG